MNNRKKVLVVEDDTWLRYSIEDKLEEWGYTVTEAVSGNDAHTILIHGEGKKNPFDAVVSDMRMPRGSGLWLCQALDGEDPAKVPPVLMHSSDMEYRGDGMHLMDLGELKKSFKFVKEVHLKPVNGDWSYIKIFLETL